MSAGPAETWALAMARRYGRRTNPASLRLARATVGAAALLDATRDVAKRRSFLDLLRLTAAHLSDCDAQEDGIDAARAMRAERRVRMLGSWAGGQAD